MPDRLASWLINHASFERRAHAVTGPIIRNGGKTVAGHAIATLTGCGAVAREGFRNESFSERLCESGRCRHCEMVGHSPPFALTEAGVRLATAPAFSLCLGKVLVAMEREEGG